MPQPFVVNCQLRQSIANAGFTCRVPFACKSHVSFSQIEWSAPVEKKRECAAKGKNNQVEADVASFMF